MDGRSPSECVRAKKVSFLRARNEPREGRRTGLDHPERDPTQEDHQEKEVNGRTLAARGEAIAQEMLGL